MLGFHAVLIPIITNADDTVFVHAIKQIESNEFSSSHYGSNYLEFFGRCECEACSLIKLEYMSTWTT